MRDKNVLMRNKISSCEIKKLSNEIKKGFSFFPLSLSYLLIDARKKIPSCETKISWCETNNSPHASQKVIIRDKNILSRDIILSVRDWRKAKWLIHKGHLKDGAPKDKIRSFVAVSLRTHTGTIPRGISFGLCRRIWAHGIIIYPIDNGEKPQSNRVE